MIAEVIVDIANSEVDRVFDYIALPDTRVGERVSVPFGKRVIEGYVIRLKPTSELDDSKLKSINRAIDDYPVILPELLKLGQFMHDNMHLRMVDCMRLFIPSQMRKGLARPLYINFVKVKPDYSAEEIIPQLRKNAVKQIELAKFLKPNQEYLVAALNKRFTSGAVGKLEDLGVMERFSALERRKPAFIPVQDKKIKLNTAQQQIVNDILKNAQQLNEYAAQAERLNVNADNNLAPVDLDKEKGGDLQNLRAGSQDTSSETVNQPTEGAFNTSDESGKELILSDNVAALSHIEKGHVHMLFGVTGSGKTEVYMNIISKVLSEGRGAIILVPEISLTPQVMSSFKSRFGEQVALLHSGLSAGERFDEWQRIRLKEARIAVGARSAIFAPMENVGVIVIDEEHDPSYKSESNPRYLTHEIAEFRAKYNHCPLILGSATPSIRSFQKAANGEYILHELPERANALEMPAIQIINMCKELREGNSGIFSRQLLDDLDECVTHGNQAMLFINRRGFSSYMICRECGYIAKCEDCDVTLVYHKEENQLKCHYCNKRYKALDACPECGSTYIRMGAIGTQRVVEELKKFFPDVKILRMDLDTTKSKNSLIRILDEFSNTKPCILVGTQMIAKGHDFPDVTLVGVMNADMSLHFSDYRSVERTYQLITQVAGRAGRAGKAGKVVLQTYTPQHYVYRLVANYNYKAFYEKEVNLREVSHFPPFAKIVRILITGEKETDAREATQIIFSYVRRLRDRFPQDFLFCEAMKSPVTRIQQKYRFQVLMRYGLEHDEEITDAIYKIVEDNPFNKVTVFVEINPSNMS